MKQIALFILSACAAVAGEQFKELKLVDGSVLKNAEIRDVLAKGLKISHEDGTGVFPFNRLPDSVRRKYAPTKEEAAAAAAEKAKQDEAAAAAVAARQKAALIAQGVEVRVSEVKSGGLFYRYFIAVHDLTGKALNGKLSVRYASDYRPDGIGSKVMTLKLSASGFTTGHLDWFTAPPCRHGEAGLRKLVWALNTEDGKRFSGEAEIPDEISEALPPDTKMER